MKKHDEIVALIRAGKDDGYRAAIELYGTHIHAFLLGVTGSPQDAEELANDTFIKAFSHINNYRAEKSAFPTWLFTIAHNIAISHLRKQPSRNLGIEAIRDKDSNLTTEDNPDEGMIDIVQKAIAMLEPEERSIIHQFYYDQASIEEISYVIGRSAGTTAVRLHRIRQKLKRIIETIHRHDR